MLHIYVYIFINVLDIAGYVLVCLHNARRKFHARPHRVRIASSQLNCIIHTTGADASHARRVHIRASVSREVV